MKNLFWSCLSCRFRGAACRLPWRRIASSVIAPANRSGAAWWKAVKQTSAAEPGRLPAPCMPAESAVVSAQVMGRIQQVLVREGDSVRAGQTLAVLDDATFALRSIRRRPASRPPQSQQAAAQTNAALAASTLERYKQLAGAEEREPPGIGRSLATR